MRKGNLSGGLILIILGCLMLAARYIFGFELLNLGPGDFWPLIILGIGLVFELLYFAFQRSPGFLVPGGIITTIGLLFCFEVVTNWRFAAYTWPIYILAVAIGLFQLYIFGGRETGLLIAVFILTTISAVFMVSMVFRSLVTSIDINGLIGIVLIVVGILAFLSRKNRN